MTGDGKIRCCDSGVHSVKHFSNYIDVLSYLAEAEIKHCTKYIKQRSFTHFEKTLTELSFGKFGSASLYVLHYVCWPKKMKKWMNITTFLNICNKYSQSIIGPGLPYYAADYYCCVIMPRRVVKIYSLVMLTKQIWTGSAFYTIPLLITSP